MRLILVAVLVLAPLASAGSADDPEISDPADDQTYGGVVPVIQPPAGVTVGLNSDLLDGWIEAFEDHLVFSIQVQGAATPTTTSASLYSFHFAVDGTDFVATAKVAAAAPVGDGGVTAGGVASEATSGSSLVTVTVPLDAIGDPAPGAVVSGFYVTAEGILFDAAHDFTVDRAPDEGFGREFVLPGDAAEPTVSFVDATLPISNQTTSPTTAAVQYNWTGAESLRILVAAQEGNISLDLRIENQTVFAWNGTSLDEVVADGVCIDSSVTPVDCRYALLVTMDGFVGTLSVAAVEEEAVPEAEPAPAEDVQEPVGNETLQDEPEDKDTPALALPVVGIGLALAAGRRRQTP